MIFRCLDVPHSIYSFTYWRTSWLLPSLGHYEWSCYKQLCAGFCVDVSFQILWVNAKECNCWIYGKSIFSFVKKLPNCFPKWQYHFALPQVIKEHSSGSTPLPACQIVVTLVEVKWDFIVWLCITAWDMMWSIFLCAYFPTAHLLLRGVC